jgi:renalase
MPPDWLETVAWISLAIAIACPTLILADVFLRGYRQRMGVMEAVWPITALYVPGEGELVADLDCGDGTTVGILVDRLGYPVLDRLDPVGLADGGLYARPTVSDATPIDSQAFDFCVVGAGFAGLRVAEHLRDAGAGFVVLDKGRSPGGRAATRRIERARVDHGVPWLTRTGGHTDALIDRLRDDGLLERLYVGGAVGDAWICPEGISKLMKHLAADLPLKLSHRAETLEEDGTGLVVHLTDDRGEPGALRARNVVFASPLPQTVEISSRLRADLEGFDPDTIYDKAVIGLARLPQTAGLGDGPVLTEAPAPGIDRVVFDGAKYPDRQPAVSIRCDAAASEDLWDAGDEEAWDWIASSLEGFGLLGELPAETQIKRWRYSQPAAPVAMTHLLVPAGEASISACGDSFDTDSPTGVEAALASAESLVAAAGWAGN